MSQERIEDFVEICEDINAKSAETNVTNITVYAMSEENLNRSKEELDVFYDALESYFDRVLESDSPLDESRIGISFVSTKPEPLPESIRNKSKKIEDKYTGNEINITILLSYSGKREIIQVADDLEEISINEFNNNLYVDNEIDLVIRTGNNPRRECLSGFPIWQTSYSEYYHIQKNFPAVERSDLEDALDHYGKMRRKRGE